MNVRQMFRYTGQALAYAAFVAFVGYFSTHPVYQHFPQDQALIRLSLSHAGQLKDKCRERSDEELARMAPNMRQRMDCSRERSPVEVLIEVDGKQVYHNVLQGSGLSKDGPSSVYQRIPLKVGTHHIVARLSDDASGKYNHSLEKTVTLNPAQVMVIDFKTATNGFTFR